MQPRVLFIMRVLSPFQLDLVRAMRGLGIDARILIPDGGIGTRPKHWSVPVPEWAILKNIRNSRRKLRRIFDDIAPHAVIYGGYRGAVGRHAAKLCRKRGVGMVFWLEQPFPTFAWRNTLRELVIAHIVRQADMLMCIGPRSMAYYQRLIPDAGRLHCVPYGADLEPNLAYERTWATEGPVTFLFSGKLVHRNNIGEMLSAFRVVRQRRGDDCRLLLSGYAGFDAEIRRQILGDAVLRPAVSWDVDFDTWDDRLRPFKHADVFLLPGLHAGWGLTVPEAMSLGMPVIGADGIESVRTLIQHGRNGLLVQPTCFDIIDAMERLIGDRRLLRTLGERAREDAMVCDSAAVAARMVMLLRPFLER